MDPMDFEDVIRACIDCGDLYRWTERDQRFARERGYLRPKRCPKCRARIREQRRDRDREAAKHD